ncbi:MAG: DUF4177 domain-containing protein [Clostridia bacterium]|nr:DUF4177 domain-containing protein [Clostridia bacterium]
MIRYEYLTLQTYSPTTPSVFSLFRQNGSESLPANNLTDAMNRLGAEGWELVSTVTSDSYGILCLFKRAPV